MIKKMAIPEAVRSELGQIYAHLTILDEREEQREVDGLFGLTVSELAEREITLHIEYGLVELFVLRREEYVEWLNGPAGIGEQK